MAKEKKNTDTVILQRLSVILPKLPDEGKERLLARIEGMSDVIEATRVTQESKKVSV